MTGTEIDRLLIRLVGDGSDYAMVLENAIRDSHAAVRRIENETKEAAAQNQMLREAAGLSLQELGGQLMSLGGTVTTIGALITGVFGGIATAGLYAAGKFEQTTIAFRTMLGSASQTTKLLNDLTTFAAETPFEMPEIEQAARGLVQFGERGDELMETLNLLGNAAAGTSTDFGMVALIFNQIRGVGHLLTQDFRQLSTRGILSLSDLAKHFNITAQEAQKMLSAGEITFEDVKDIFRDLSGEGGRFHDLMKEQSKSLLGILSTLKDNLRLVGRELGEYLVPAAKLVVNVFNDMVGIFRSMPTWVKAVAATIVGLGAVTGIALVSLGGMLLTAGSLAFAYTALTGAIGSATIAAIAFNVATAGLGIILAGALAFLGYEIYTLIAGTDEATGKFEKLGTGVGALAKSFKLPDIAEQVADANKFVDSLHEQVDTWGMTANQAKIAKMEIDGVARATLDEAKAADDLLNTLKETDRLKDEGKRLTEEVRTPGEVYSDRMDELNNMIQFGVISWETYRRAVENADKALDSATKTRREFARAEQPIGVVTQRTSAGFSAVQQGNRESERLAKAQIENQKRQLGEQKRAADILARMERNRGPRLQPVSL